MTKTPYTPALYRLLTKKRRLMVALTITILLCLLFGGLIIQRLRPTTSSSSHKSSPVTQTSPTQVSSTLIKETPNYPTITPDGKGVNQQGGWTRVSPPDHNAVYAYTDTISGVSLIVSQQPLPDSFKKDSSTAIKDLAASYNANRSLQVDGTTVYIGTSTKGPQSVICIKKELLILIKSSAVLNDTQWTAYISSLK